MKILTGHESGKTVWGLAISPDSEQLASAAWDNTIRVWDLATGQNRVVDQASSDWVEFSPDGSRLAYRKNIAVVTDMSGGEPLRLASAVFQRMVFSPDGNSLLGIVNSDMVVHDSHTGRRTAAHHLGERNGISFDLSRDHSLVAFTDHTVRARAVLVSAYPAMTPLARFTEVTAWVTALAFSPDARFVAAASERTLLVWDIRAKERVLRDRPDTKHFKSVAFSPDGQWLAAAHNDNCVRMYSTRTWQVQETLDWGIGPLVAVRFAPDGMRAAASSKKGKIVVWDIDP